MANISQQQRRFVETYTQCHDAVEAVLRAGYKAQNTEHRAAVLMANPYIQQESRRYEQILAVEPRIKELLGQLRGGDAQ
jgi:phage terminase small subunit